MDRLVYSVPEAAQVLGISEWLCRRQIAQGRIPVARYGRRVVVPRAALEATLAEIRPEAS